MALTFAIGIPSMTRSLPQGRTMAKLVHYLIRAVLAADLCRRFFGKSLKDSHYTRMQISQQMLRL